MRDVLGKDEFNGPLLFLYRGTVNLFKCVLKRGEESRCNEDGEGSIGSDMYSRSGVKLSLWFGISFTSALDDESITNYKKMNVQEYEW